MAPRFRPFRVGPLLISTLVLAGATLQAVTGYAQVTTAITSSGLGTAVTSKVNPTGGTTYEITGGTRPREGPNLFHSFGLFSIGAGDTASFQNTTPALTTRNILSRVTGGESSNIFGTISTLSYPGANLFLINPAGVIFGPNAILNVGGSFHVGTADYLRFADGAKFSANLPQNSMLTVARPEAFGFLGPTPAPLIVLGSSLQVPTGQTLSLVGGGIAQTLGSLSALNGRIQIVSVGSAGEVQLSASDGTPNLRLVDFSNLGFVDLSGAPVPVAGTVLIRGYLLGSVPDSHIVLDGSLGAGAPLFGPNFRIPAEAGQIRGRNLFESFSRFDLYAGESATFQTPLALTPISNIVARVTGGEQSFIDGTLHTDIPGANLFFLNPAGVLFGPNASLALLAAFHVSSATYLGFGDKFILSVLSPLAPFDPNNPPVLTSTSPVAFGFAQPAPAAISVLGSTLQVLPGNTLSLIGGDVQIVGASLAAGGIRGGPGGRVVIASVGSPGEVAFNSTTQSPDLNLASFSALGQIRITQGSSVDASGDGGGTVVIRGGQLIIDGAQVGAVTLGAADGAPTAVDVQLSDTLTVSNGGLIASQTSRASCGNARCGNAGNVEITTGALEVSASGNIDGSTFGSGAGGSISVTARDSIALTNFGEISSETFGAGRAGSIALNAKSGSVMISGSQTGIQSSNQAGTGDAGNIVINTRTLTLTDGAQIGSGTFAAGRGGTLIVNATESATISGQSPDGKFQSAITASSEGTGDAGTVTVNTATLTLRDGGQIASGTRASGQGGSVAVAATDGILIAGQGIKPSGIFTSSMATGTGTGDAGSLSVSTPRLIIAGGGQIASSTFGSGRGGSMTITATDSVAISGRGTDGSPSGLLARSLGGTGNGGDITLTAGAVRLSNDAVISAISSGTGDAGNLTLASTGAFRIQDSAVTTQATTAGGGKIDLTAGSRSLLYLTDSRITTSVQSGKGGGGNIMIDPQFVILDHSQVRADAFGGPGGNIDILADVFLASESIISASSALSTPGTINIQAQITDLSGSVAQLPGGLLQAGTLLRASCAARVATGKASSLVVAGREGLPLEPGGYLPSPLLAPEAGEAVRSSDEGHYWETFPRFSRSALAPACPR